MSGFLDIFQKWWTVANSKQWFQPNQLGNFIVKGDKEFSFKKL